MNKEKIANAVGRKLRQLRYIHGYEQKYLAHFLGINQSYYSKIENYDPISHAKFLPKLAEIYHIDCRYLYEECEWDLYLDDSIGFTRFYTQIQISDVKK